MPAVVHCVIVNRKSLWSYRGEDTVPFIKIICAEPKAIPKVKDKLALVCLCADLIRLFERGQVEYKGLFHQETMTYESNIAYTLRFMIDTKVQCAVEVRLTLDCWNELGRSTSRPVRDSDRV